ncbi:MAG: hypothetical protein WAT20_05920 [Ferruginibacter sp.]|nr:YHS domain-containing protein [Chitinophagaceae bacterium]
MKKNIGIFLIAAIVACNQPKAEKAAEKTVTETMKKDTVKADFDNLLFAVKNDLVCGMPVSAGISDTAHYKGGVYGFCAAECKAEFVKSPTTYLSAKQ